MRSEQLLATVFLVAVAGLGCRLGPEPGEKPVTAADLAESYVNAEAVEAPEVGRWWETLGDPVRADLVDSALSDNPDLRAAAARYLAAEAEQRVVHGARWPQLQLGLDAARSKNSFALPGAGLVSVYSTTYSNNLSVSWATDLFGKLARADQAAWASLLASDADRQAVVHAVVAGVVRSRVAIATLEWRVEQARATEESWRESLALVERRYRNGLIDSLDVALTRQSLAAAEAASAALQSALRRARHALDVLLGRQPGTGSELAGTLPDLPGPELPPTGLPVQLLERRPDVVAAEQQLAAATARVGVAIADLFPSLTLTGSGGTRSAELSELLDADRLIYNAVAGLLAPIFSGGRLRAQVDVAEARAEEAAQRYASTVLVALREVEDALVREAGLRQIVASLEVAATEARIGAEIARARYELGTGDLLSRLESQRRRFASVDALLVSRGDLWNARVDLHLALGGDWDRPMTEETLSEESSR